MELRAPMSRAGADAVKHTQSDVQESSRYVCLNPEERWVGSL